MEEIEDIKVGKWTRLFIYLKDGTQFWEDGNESDATDWKWAEHQSFYDKNWLSIDEEEINGGLKKGTLLQEYFLNPHFKPNKEEQKELEEFFTSIGGKEWKLN